EVASVRATSVLVKALESTLETRTDAQFVLSLTVVLSLRVNRGPQSRRRNCHKEGSAGEFHPACVRKSTKASLVHWSTAAPIAVLLAMLRSQWPFRTRTR